MAMPTPSAKKRAAVKKPAGSGGAAGSIKAKKAMRMKFNQGHDKSDYASVDAYKKARRSFVKENRPASGYHGVRVPFKPAGQKITPAPKSGRIKVGPGPSVGSGFPKYVPPPLKKKG